MTVARSSCDHSAIDYVLPVSWMTSPYSCLYIMKRIDHRNNNIYSCWNTYADISATIRCIRYCNTSPWKYLRVVRTEIEICISSSSILHHHRIYLFVCIRQLTHINSNVHKTGVARLKWTLIVPLYQKSE